MSLLVWTELVCDTCAKQGPGEWQDKAIRRKVLWHAAERKGWLRLGDVVFCSEKCKAEFEATDDASLHATTTSRG